jgi:hypothetical protein
MKRHAPHSVRGFGTGSKSDAEGKTTAMLNFGPWISPTLSVLVCVMLTSSSTLSADRLTDELADQLVEQVADLKSNSEQDRPLLLITQDELDALPLDTVVSWTSKPISPEGPTIDVKKSELPSGRHTVEIEISDVAENLSRKIFTVTVK